MRRLPRNFTKEELLKDLEKNEQKYETFHFVNSDEALHPFVFTRAYFTFKDDEEAYLFCKKFDGKLFVDSKENKSMAIVERAPSQDIPKADECTDKRMNTLESDSDYLKFFDEYNSSVKKVDFEALVREIEEKHRRLEEMPIQETPLLEFIVDQELKKTKRRTEKDLPKTKAENQKRSVEDFIDKQNIPKVSKKKIDKPKKQTREREDIDKTKTKKSTSTRSKGEKTRKLENNGVTGQLTTSDSKPTTKTSYATKLNENSRNSVSTKPKELTSNKMLENLESVKSESKTDENEANGKNEEKQRLRRNKDRPEREIYRPKRVRELEKPKDVKSGVESVVLEI